MAKITILKNQNNVDQAELENGLESLGFSRQEAQDFVIMVLSESGLDIEIKDQVKAQETISLLCSFGVKLKSAHHNNNF